ncbi:MAG: hypothetical protein Q9186_002665 [Xanthomendoza sp. 1 TL-2023]
MSTNSPEQSSTPPIIKRKASEPPDQPLNHTPPLHEAKKSKVDSPSQETSASIPQLPPSSTSTSPHTPPPQTPTRPQPPSRGTPILPPPKDWRPMPNHTPLQSPGTHLSSANPSPNTISTLARETTRKKAARHLKRARDDLVETIRIQGLNRHIAGTSNTAAVAPLPPPLPSSSLPSPSPSPSTTIPPSLQDQNIDPSLREELYDEQIAADFAAFGRGKQDWDVNDSVWSGVEMGSYRGLGVTDNVEETLAEQDREGAGKEEAVEGRVGEGEGDEGGPYVELGKGKGKENEKEAW